MKLIGFIKEHNNIKEAVDYTVFKEEGLTNNYVLSDIVSYLNSGVYILGWMGYFFDIDNDSPISPDSYYTDGVYIWPAYFPHYLQKHPNSQIDEDFLADAVKNNFWIDPSKINDRLKDQMEIELLKRITIR